MELNGIKTIDTHLGIRNNAKWLLGFTKVVTICCNSLESRTGSLTLSDVWAVGVARTMFLRLTNHTSVHVDRAVSAHNRHASGAVSA